MSENTKMSRITRSSLYLEFLIFLRDPRSCQVGSSQQTQEPRIPESSEWHVSFITCDLCMAHTVWQNSYKLWLIREFQPLGANAHKKGKLSFVSYFRKVRHLTLGGHHWIKWSLNPLN